MKNLSVLFWFALLSAGASLYAKEFSGVIWALICAYLIRDQDNERLILLGISEGWRKIATTRFPHEFAEAKRQMDAKKDLLQ